MKLLELFLTFLKIGLFTFGGGYAMISVVEDNCVERKKWITHEEMMNMTVVAESTPGPVAINAATYVGFRRAGVPGAAAATIGVVLPSFVIIYAISLFLDRFLELTVIANAFQGIKVGVGVLIFTTGLNMAKKLEKKPLSLGIFICGFFALLAIEIFSLHFSSIALLLIAAVVSLAVFLGKGGVP